VSGSRPLWIASITTKVAIAAQQASGSWARRAMTSDAAAATAVRIACSIDGGSLSSPIQCFMMIGNFPRLLPTLHATHDFQPDERGPGIMSAKHNVKVVPLANDQSKVYLEGAIGRRWNPIRKRKPES
jgi:hypothetical protein